MSRGELEAIVKGYSRTAGFDQTQVNRFTLLNPVNHFSTIARGILLRGAGLEMFWPHLLALVGFALLLVGISAWRFRKQLG
jgi:ABC-type polysaccharide/polyol phosphate export permease